MTKRLFSNYWFLVYEEDYSQGIGIKFHPNLCDSGISIPAEDMAKITKKFMRTAAKQLGLPARYFDPDCRPSFCSYDGWHILCRIFEDDRWDRKFKEDQLKTLFEGDDFMEEVADLLCDYVVNEDLEDA